MKELRNLIAIIILAIVVLYVIEFIRCGVWVRG